jgi:urea transport system substrate-binding protein
MVLSYDGVYLWKEAAEKAGTFDVDKVRETLESGDINFAGPGGTITMTKNHHATKNVYIGETMANGQFKILKSFDQVLGEPFLLKGLDEKLAAAGK